MGMMRRKKKKRRLLEKEAQPKSLPNPVARAKRPETVGEENISEI